MNQRTVLQRRWDLKAATAPYHERIDRLDSFYGMFISLDAYRKYLEATWRSRVALETLLDVSDLRRVFSDWDNHKIQSELQMDYADLVSAPGTVRDTWQSRSETWPVGRRLLLCFKPCRSTKKMKNGASKPRLTAFARLRSITRKRLVSHKIASKIGAC